MMQIFWKMGSDWDHRGAFSDSDLMHWNQLASQCSFFRNRLLPFSRSMGIPWFWLRKRPSVQSICRLRTIFHGILLGGLSSISCKFPPEVRIRLRPVFCYFVSLAPTKRILHSSRALFHAYDPFALHSTQLSCFWVEKKPPVAGW